MRLYKAELKETEGKGKQKITVGTVLYTPNCLRQLEKQTYKHLTKGVR